MESLKRIFLALRGHDQALQLYYKWAGAQRIIFTNETNDRVEIWIAPRNELLYVIDRKRGPIFRAPWMDPLAEDEITRVVETIKTHAEKLIMKGLK